MPDPTPAKTGALSKKLGPLSRGAWLAVGAGVFGAYYLYRRYETNAAAAGTAAATTTAQPVTTTPIDTTSNGSTGAGYTTLGAWESAAIAAMVGAGADPADALNGITSWLNGSCVSASQYTNLDGVLTSVGLPPGFSTLPTLSVCSSSTGSPSAGSGAAPNPGGALRGTQVLQGAGYWFPNSTVPITDGAGNAYTWIDQAQFKYLHDSGQAVYYEVTPGNFIQYFGAPGSNTAGTPLYTLSQAAAASSGTTPSTATTGTAPHKVTA